MSDKKKPDRPIPKAWINAHKGKTCVVLGNGPSISDYDLKHIFFRKHITIGTNTIGKVFDPSYYLICDKRAWEWNRKWMERSKKRSGSVMVLRYTLKGIPHDAHRIRYNADNVFGLPEMGGEIYHGRTAGIVALNLAFQMGFSRVYMLGIDGFGCGGSTHFHNEHEDERDQVKEADERDVTVAAALMNLMQAFHQDDRELLDLSRRSMWSDIVPKGDIE